MLDKEGYRPNVGIVLVNHRNQVFWGKRINQHSWQFPQGGIKHGEAPVQAMYRELYEELGLRIEHVKVLGRTRHWLRYEVPDQFVRREWRGAYRGQKQIWFLLRLVGRDSDVCLRATKHPEFDAWRWSDFWLPLQDVIDFKRQVYDQALNELARILFKHLHDARANRKEAGSSDAYTDVKNSVDSSVDHENGLEALATPTLSCLPAADLPTVAGMPFKAPIISDESGSTLPSSPLQAQ